MSDNKYKTEDPSLASSRFDHKSQGMRSMSLNEKKASEEVVESLYYGSVNTDKTTKTSYPEGSSSVSKNSASYRTTSAGSAKKSSNAAGYNNAAQKTQGVSSKVSRVFSEPDNTAASSDGLGISVFVNKSDIPAYEIGFNSDDFYVPDEIKNGKVSKISSDQIDEMERRSGRKRKSSSGKKKSVKKKKTPAQKALKAVIWIAIWLVVFLIAFLCYRTAYEVFYDVAVNPDSTTTFEYTVEAGATDESVYEDLCELGVMNCSEFIYKLRAIVFEAEYVEGTYTISDGYNIEKIINILAGYNYSDDDE